MDGEWEWEEGSPVAKYCEIAVAVSKLFSRLLKLVS